MSNERRSILLKLASAAYEMDLDSITGVLQRDDDGRWFIHEQDILRWLATHEGEEVVLIMGSLDDDQPVQTRTCRTCGRDYTDLECPYCRANRIRLRGHL
jgi:hypothetical protein